MIIKKLNGMFHKHGRWLFSVITVVIIVSFLGFLTPGQFGFDGMFGPGGIRVGTVYGEKVTYDDLVKEIRSLMLFQYVFLGSSSNNINPEQAFISYSFVQAAKRRGITASDKEIAKLIESSPALQNNGKFDLAKYKEVMAQIVARGGSDAEVADAFRNILLQEKLRAEIAGNVVVTPNEAEQLYRSVNASFKISAAVFNSADFKSKVANDAEKLRKYFTDNQRLYTIKAKVSGLVVEFPYADYRNAAEKAATAVELQKYFNANKNMFLVDGKLPEYKSVAGKVKTAFVTARSQDMAKAAAYDFAEEAYNTVGELPIDKRPAELKKLIVTQKARMIETGMVESDVEVLGGKKLPGLAAQLAEAVNSANPVTEIFSGETGAYVGLAVAGVSARNANFNEVAQVVNKDFVEAEAAQLARKAAVDARAALEKISAPAARAKAFAALKNCKIQTFEFSSKTMPPAGLENVAFSAYSLTPGEISPVVAVPAGAAIAELVSRIPANMKEYAAQAKQYETMCRNSKASSALVAFQEELARECKFNAEALNR